MEINELGVKPISSDKPTGADAKYEPEYEELIAEVEKLSGLGAKAIDWNKVLKLSTTILAEKSKDLLVACYLTLALLQTKGLDGLTEGAMICKDLVENFWDDLFPPKSRMRGRINALSWLADSAQGHLKNFTQTDVPPETVKKLTDALNALDKTLGSKMEDAPSILPLVRAIEMIPTKQEEGAQPAAGASGERPAQVAPAKTETKVASADGAQNRLSNALEIFGQVADYYLETDLSNPLIYYLNRVIAWLPVDSLPPATDGKTRIPPPDDQLKKSLSTLYSNGEWINVIRSAESRVTQILFWLDLSQMVYEALGRSGDKYKPAQDMVALQTSVFVAKLKGIEDLTFSDDTPFAGPAAKKWIKENALSLGPSQSATTPMGFKSAAAGSEEAAILQEYETALTLINQKKLPEAMTLLMDKLKISSNAKSRMLRRMTLAQLLLGSHNEKLAIPQMEQIIEDIKTYRLEEWDPDLALRGLKLVFSGIVGQPDAKYKAISEEILDRIAKLSPMEALKLSIK